MNQYPHPRLGSWTVTQLIVLQFCVVTSHGVAVLLKGSQDAIRIPLLSKGMLFQQSEDLTELNLTKFSSSSSQLWVDLRCRVLTWLQTFCTTPAAELQVLLVTHVCH